MLKENIDIFVFSETKIDESFPINQFNIDGFSIPIRLDRNDEGGGIIIYIRSDIPYQILKNSLPNKIEVLYIEIKLGNKKWPLFGGYNPKKENISYLLNYVGKDLDKLIGNYDNILLIGDFNSQIEVEKMKEFCESYNLENFIRDPTYYKNVLNPTSIDMILTNRAILFTNSCSITRS